MNKNIVLCSDGTGNQDIKDRGTNVYKLYESVDIHGHKGDNTLRPQIAVYDDGVGTQSSLVGRLLGNAVGWGFCWNVQKLYRQLARVYVPGDHIYLFGFSRGAYTVRALAGMIQFCGVSDISQGLSDTTAFHDHVEQCWDEFYQACFTKERDDKRTVRTAAEVQSDQRRVEKIERRKRLKAHEPERPLNIELVGVWDTVGAIAMPVDELKYITDFIWPSRFRDLVPGEEIKRARHALALDDERKTFAPELWKEKGEKDPERIKQVWFAGAHSNVGGGYPKHGMSLVSLDWMMAEAERCGPQGKGLRFVEADRKYAGTHQDVHDKLYDSRAGFGVYYRWQPRDVSDLCAKHDVEPKVHITVFERIAMRTDGYAPCNIPYASKMAVTEPSMWPGKVSLARIESRLSREGTKGSVLDRLRNPIRLGRSSHAAFLLLSAVGIAALICPPEWLTLFPEEEWWWEPRLYVLVLMVILGLAIRQWAGMVDTKIDKVLTAFWEGVRKDLREILHGESASKQGGQQAE